MAKNLVNLTYVVKSISNPRGNTWEVELKFINLDLRWPGCTGPELESLSSDYAEKHQIPDEITVHHICNPNAMAIQVGNVVVVWGMEDQLPCFNDKGEWERHIQILQYQELQPC